MAMNASSILSTVPTLVGHFFRHAFRKVTTWLIFILAPILAIVGMYLIVGDDAIGVLVFFTFLSAGIIAMLSVKEKELGIYRRILVSPVTGAAYSVALFVAVYLVLSAETILVLSVLYLVPPVRPDLPFLPVVGIMLVWAAPASAFGALLTAFVSTSTQGSVVANVVAMLTGFVSGCFWPVRIMPEYLKQAARILPQTWVNLALDDLATAAGPALWAKLGLLLLYALVFLLLYALLFRRKTGG
jgi:ABC-2 type transport system permease protein